MRSLTPYHLLSNTATLNFAWQLAHALHPLPFHTPLHQIPAGSDIISAKLFLNVNLGKNLGQDRPSSLHRLNADWGEGASSWFGGSGAEGKGTEQAES
jgi:hypothetical protein